MEIIKYATKSCVKCQVLDRILKGMTLPCDVKTLYVEDEGIESFENEGIDSMPTLKIKNNDKEKVIVGLTSPEQINIAIQEVQ